MRLTLLSRTVASLSCPSSFRSTFALVNNRIFSSLYPHSVKHHRKRKAKVLFHDVIFVIINLTQRPRFFFASSTIFLRNKLFASLLPVPWNSVSNS